MNSFKRICFFIFVLVIYCSRAKLQIKHFFELHRFTDLNFSFPTKQDELNAIDNGFYVMGNAIPVDVEIEYGDDGHHRTFLAIPRLEAGIPYSLAIISNKSNQAVVNPVIEPYPSYNWHSISGSSCKGIVSAIRVVLDACWRLWVIDSGQIDAVQRCPPQILAFDLITDKLHHQYTIPADIYVPGISVFTAAAVDVGDTIICRDVHLYIADPWGYGLIVYDAFARKSWRIEHEYMQPDIKLQKLNSAIDGIFTVSLSPPTTKKRMVFFHSLNSFKEIAVPLDIVNNETIWKTNPDEASNAFKVIGDRGVQCESEVMDSVGNLFCSIISYNALIRWRDEREYNPDTIDVVGYHPQQLKFVTGLKINKNSQNEDELWALSSTPKIFSRYEIEEGETKFEIIGCRISDLLNKQDCTVSAMGQI